MDFESGVLVVLEDWERGVPRSGTDFEECGGRGVGGGDAREDGKFLLQPLAVLEEVGGVVLVEVVPPLRRVGIESGFFGSSV